MPPNAAPGDTIPMSAFLDVEASVTGRRWLGPAPEKDRLGEAIAHEAGLAAARALALAPRRRPGRGARPTSRPRSAT